MIARRQLASFGGTALVCVVGLAVLYFARPPSSPDGAGASATAPVVRSGAAATATDSRGFVGVIIADESVDVAARVAGQVTAIDVRLGDRVASGDPIASIDDRALRADLAVTSAGLSAAVADRDRAALELAEARDTEKRWRDMDTANTSTVSAEKLQQLGFQAQYAEQRVKSAEAKVAEFRAQLADLRRKLADTTVRAPFDGIIAHRHVDSGATVSEGAPLVRLVRAGEFWVRFAVPEQTDARLRNGLEVVVRVDTLAAELSATVAKIAPEVDAASRMLFVEARLAIPEELAGMPLAGRVARVHLRPTGELGG